jgi:anti-sigma regulatory factor (Ser/Thr protein kinase)/biotin operon repressor
MSQDLKKLILARIRKRGQVKVAEIVKATGFSRAYVNRKFQELRDEGKIVLIGKANQARYQSSAEKTTINKLMGFSDSFNRIYTNKHLSESEVFDEIKKETKIFTKVNNNIETLVRYAFTELLNNAIDHSSSKEIRVKMTRDEVGIKFSVEDKGVGIFNHIKKKKKLKNTLEAIQDLTKGKLTTAPKAHTGEGIFFTSKVADTLVLVSENKKLTFNNILDDIFINDSFHSAKGTKARFIISLKSKKILTDIFKEYTDKTYEFSKTSVVVKLFKGGTEYISRSQARRILIGLEKFKVVVLDFLGVETVGQGFADEVFRVWQNNFPQIKIEYKNANQNIKFMIERV